MIALSKTPDEVWRDATRSRGPLGTSVSWKSNEPNGKTVAGLPPSEMCADSVTSTPATVPLMVFPGGQTTRVPPAVNSACVMYCTVTDAASPALSTTNARPPPPLPIVNAETSPVPVLPRHAPAPPRLSVTAPVKLVRVRLTVVVPLAPGRIVRADGDRDSPSATSAVLSLGSLVVTKTWNVNVVTVVGTLNCHCFGLVDSPDGTTPSLYRKYSWLVPVNDPTPSEFATVTVPDPPVTVGSEWKNTLMPSASGVVPSAVLIGCAMRFSTVTLDENTCVPELYEVPLDPSRTSAP